MSPLGRQLLSSPPSSWVELHKLAWPVERFAFQEAAGRAISAALNGEALLVHPTAPDQPAQVELQAIPPADCEALDLPLPEPFEPGTPATSALALDALMLPTAVRGDPTWVLTQLPPRSWIELTSLDAVVCQLLLGPVMADLAAIFVLRAGAGPTSEKGKQAKLRDCRETHEVLGLRTDLVEPLLDPKLDRAQVIEARQALVRSWSDQPEDLGARVMALFCGRLARAYYAKARKDGTIEQSRVINSKTKPLLDVTLRNWTAFVAYLGEELAAADAQPLAIPDTALPQEAPAVVRERIETLRAWWQLYDEMHAGLKPNGRSLLGLVPPRWETTYVGEDSARREPELYRRLLPDELVERIERLWGLAIVPRFPEVLVTESRPFGRFVQMLSPAIDVWDELASTCWSLCFTDYSRLALPELEGRHAGARRQLEQLSAPIETSIYAELMAAAQPHQWLLEPRPLVIGIQLSVSAGGVTLTEGEPPSPPSDRGGVFMGLKEIIDRHRARWLSNHLHGFLDALWRRDVTEAAAKYWQRYRGKGRAPTLKQSLVEVQDAANRWFNADYSALASAAGLDGPITSPPLPTDRRLPADLPSLEHDIAMILAPSTQTSKLDDRIRRYRLMQLVSKSRDILVHWQASGEAPPRAAILAAADDSVCRELLSCELEDGYKLLLAATREALRRAGHVAARELEEG